MEEILLKIVGWEKYQSKSERARYKYWFRVNMDCGTSHGLFGLNAEQKWFYIQLLCECCRKDTDTISIKISRFVKLCEISESSIISAIKMLEENGTVSILSSDSQQTHNLLKQHNITEHNNTEQNIYVKDVKACALPLPPKDSGDRLVGKEELGKKEIPCLQTLWNTFCGELPKARGMTKSRQKKWEARWKEVPELGYWQHVITKMAKSSFCNGSNDWKATIDWILKNDANHQKVFEGNYDDELNTPENQKYIWSDEATAGGD